MISAEDRHLLDRVRERARTKSPNRLAKDAGVSINTARSLKEGRYPRRLTTDVREKWLAYLDEDQSSIGNDVPRETGPTVPVNPRRCQKVLEALERSYGRVDPAHLVGLAAEVGANVGWNEDEWGEWNRWRAGVLADAPTRALVPIEAPPGGLPAVVARQNDELNRLRQELDGLPKTDPVSRRRRAPGPPMIGGRRVLRGRVVPIEGDGAGEPGLLQSEG